MGLSITASRNGPLCSVALCASGYTTQPASGWSQRFVVPSCWQPSLVPHPLDPSSCTLDSRFFGVVPPPPHCLSYALVQATFGVGTVIFFYTCIVCLTTTLPPPSCKRSSYALHPQTFCEAAWGRLSALDKLFFPRCELHVPVMLTSRQPTNHT